MAGRVEGKVALVTGGASGIGRATALTFAREGAKLVVADTNEDGGQQTVHMITENGGEATFVQVDVTSASAVEAFISKTVETYGRLDCAHNNAGVIQRAYPPTAEFPEDEWHRVLAVNLTGVWLCMKYEIPQMLQQGRGAIVNTASVAGLVGLPYASASTLPALLSISMYRGNGVLHHIEGSVWLVPLCQMLNRKYHTLLTMRTVHGEKRPRRRQPRRYTTIYRMP